MKKHLSKNWLFMLVPAVALRFWNLWGLGLTHFDEGSYAMAGQWIASFGDQGAPPQAGHAPGLFPVLVGLVFFFLGSHDYFAIAVSAATGSLTVVLIWWIGRSWFGDTVAGGAALLLATCEYHLIYSRMALTDATFVLFFWAALALLSRGLETKSSHWLLVGGVCTGLAWNTKYHGFLPLLITALFCCLHKSAGTRLLRNTARLGWACAVACLSILPWILVVALTTGWRPVLAGQWNHSFGSGPFPATLPSTLYFYLENWVAGPVLLLSLAGAAVVLARRDHKGMLLTGTVFVVGVAALFYTSFPRLLLPLIPGLCLLAALGAVSLLGVLSQHIPVRRSASLLFVVLSFWNVYEALPVLQIGTDSYREAAEFVHGQPEPQLTQLSKNYYFYDEGVSTEMRWHTPGELDNLVSKQNWIVAIDPVLWKLPLHRQWVEQRLLSMTLLRELPIRTYDVVYYQGIRQPRALDSLPREEAPLRPDGVGIRVYRVSTSGQE